MILLVFRRKKLRSVLVFDLTSFPDKIYHWREALERRNFDTSRLLRNGHPLFLQNSN